MKYGLDIYVEEFRCGSIHCVEKSFDNLEEAEYYYNQYDGIEYFNQDELDNEVAEIRYIISINIEENGSYTKFFKGKYKPLDLEDYYSDFWKLFNSLLNEKGTRF